MLEFIITEKLKPNEQLLSYIHNTSYKINRGQIRILNGTNLKFVKPTEYIITKPIKLTILEYEITEISNKPYYIKEHHKKYSFKEINNMLNQLTK